MDQEKYLFATWKDFLWHKFRKGAVIEVYYDYNDYDGKWTSSLASRLVLEKGREISELPKFEVSTGARFLDSEDGWKAYPKGEAQKIADEIQNYDPMLAHSAVLKIGWKSGFYIPNENYRVIIFNGDAPQRPFLCSGEAGALIVGKEFPHPELLPDLSETHMGKFVRVMFPMGFEGDIYRLAEILKKELNGDGKINWKTAAFRASGQYGIEFPWSPKADHAKVNTALWRFRLLYKAASVTAHHDPFMIQ